MTKICKFRITLLLLIWSAPNLWAQNTSQGQADNQGVRVIEPEQKKTESKAALIDTEKFELGFYFGNLAVEDFGNDLASGIEFSYRIDSRWLVQGTYGQVNIDRASFESSQQQFLSDSDRDFKYLAVAAGYRLIQGRSFLGARNKYESELFLLAGPEQVDFAGNSEVGLVFGLSYRIVLTDWMTTNVDFREHLFKREFIGDSKQTFNTEVRWGFNFLF